MRCEYCNIEFKNNNNVDKHKKSCIKIQGIKNELIDLYVNEYKSINFLREKFKIGGDTIINILGDKKRTQSEALTLIHRLYPDKFLHSDETKQKLSKIRLKWMKNNPEKTAWRLANMSYPEKQFLNKIKNIGWDKKYLIIREKSIHPYYIDFAFIDEKIAIEIDGSQHELNDRKEQDKKKDKKLISEGWRVLRFPATNILLNLDDVIKKIESFIDTDIKYERVGIYKYEKQKYYCECGNQKSKISKRCKKCDSINQRKVERPNIDTLIQELSESNYTKLGKKYGVSDNTIRKWIKK